MSSIELSSRAKILDVREQRLMAQGLEIREDAKSGQFILEGYAATYEPYDCYGGVERGGWIEQIDPKAFDKTLKGMPDVQLLINHEGLMRARTTSGTLKLSVDDKGLKVRALLDNSDPDVQRVAPKMRRGDLNEMSFAFRVLDQKWDSSYTHRLITEVSLQRGDVSIVSYGMNPDTHAVLTEHTVAALARMTDDQLVELRSKVDRTELRQAVNALRRAAGEPDVRAAGNPTANMIASNLVEPNLDNAVTDGAVNDGPVGAGIYDKPSIITEGNSDSPVKYVSDPEESALSVTLVATLESTIIKAYGAAESDSMRSMLAEAVGQIALLRQKPETSQEESAVEKQLRKLQESDPTHPSHKDEMKDDEEEDEDEDRGAESDQVEPRAEDVQVERAETDDDEECKSDDTEDEEEEEEIRIGTVSDALRKLHGDAGIPAITNVREGLAYVSTFKRSK